MMQALSIAGGGALGALLRFYLTSGIHALFGQTFPYGTLVVNVSGSLLMGLCYTLFMERISISSELRSAILIGLLGAFTTFSAFSMETLKLIEKGELSKAALNILLSIVLCVGAAWAGTGLGRQLQGGE